MFDAGSPTAPLNLSITENGFGSLYVSWLHATIEGVADKFTLIATNLNDSNADPIVVTGIEDLHQTITIPDNSSCDMYSFQVTATNDAGSSGPSTTTGKFPSAVACDKDTSGKIKQGAISECYMLQILLLQILYVQHNICSGGFSETLMCVESHLILGPTVRNHTLPFLVCVASKYILPSGIHTGGGRGGGGGGGLPLAQLLNCSCKAPGMDNY